ncbi:MAG: O-antigen ligase family protein [Rhodothermaceae bacterium]|nr:O-antigen ligase family protein [Rhodothermaceae bacterium]MYE63120.1 O-antigen ligase family protein [Rhodothermaceae bacterium]MYJ20461.1 O-antigen ligase family protein [Rhodothermaceae bacterium]
MQQVGVQLSPLKVYHTGNALIITGLILSLGLTFALSSTGSVPFLIAFPAAVLGIIAVGFFLVNPLLSLMITILGFVLVASNEAGFQVIEIAYAAFLYAFLLTWFLRHAISESSEILTGKTDLALALFLGLLPATLILTYFFRGDFLVAFSELISLSMLLVYFPVKHTVVNHRIGPKLMLTTVVIMSVLVAIINSFEYASDLSNATHLSHISGSRVVVNDALLTIGSLMSLALLVYARNPISLLLSASAVAFTFAGLIMTQARGAWLAFMLGMFVLLLIARTPERIKILTTGAIVSVLILGIGYILLGPFLNVIIKGITERFSTIATAFTQDLSLINRFRETQAVFEKIIMNPLIGYGPGVSYVFYDIVHVSTDTDSFVHNGYIGLWYKYGLWGLGLVLYFWYSTVKLGLRAFRSDTTDHWTRLAGLAGAIPLVALTITTLVGNPFFLKNQLFIIAIAAGLAVGAGERSSILAIASKNHT